jgi:hypothetical protein
MSKQQSGGVILVNSKADLLAADVAEIKALLGRRWAVDTHVTNTNWVIPDATWNWLDSVIGTAPGPVLLADHYPLWELGVAAVNAVQPTARMAELISEHPNVAGMIAGHMHWEIGDSRQARFVQVGNRDLFPIVTDVSSMLSISSLTRDQSAQLPSISTVISMSPERWELRYRLHGPHAWGGPGGSRVTTMCLETGQVTRSMGSLIRTCYVRPPRALAGSTGEGDRWPIGPSPRGCVSTSPGTSSTRAPPGPRPGRSPMRPIGPGAAPEPRSKRISAQTRW